MSDTDLARAEAAHDEALRAVHHLRESRHALCLALARIASERLYRVLGFGSLQDYAEARLGLAPRTSRAMTAVGRRLPDLPALDAAMADGTLSWTKARTLLAVADPDNVAEWVERASELSNRELEAQVAACTPGEVPPDAERAAEIAAMPGLRRFAVMLDDAQHRLVTDTLATLGAQTSLSKEELSDGTLLANALQRLLVSLDTEETPTGSRFQVVLQQCECGVTAGLDVPADQTQTALATCDAEVVDLRPGPDQGAKTSDIPARVRRAVIARDAWRCVNPRCSSTLWFDLHHLRFRSRGGEHEAGNLVTLCSNCHHALHDGYLGVSRTAEDGVIEFAYRDGGVVRVRLGEGPLETRGPRGPLAVPPSPRRLLAFGTRGLRRVGRPGAAEVRVGAGP